MSSLFDKIISGEIAAHKIAENENYLAFLDLMPVAKGHTLVIPKKPIDYIFDMQDQDICGLMIFAKQIALGLKSAIDCKKIGVSIIGLEVPHAHIHLVPMQELNDINFSKPKHKADDFELFELATYIRSFI